MTTAATAAGQTSSHLRIRGTDTARVNETDAYADPTTAPTDRPAATPYNPKGTSSAAIAATVAIAMAACTFARISGRAIAFAPSRLIASRAFAPANRHIAINARPADRHSSPNTSTISGSPSGKRIREAGSAAAITQR